MNIQQVIYAMEVYDFHSFTEAAKSLYISQPRLSQAIRELEEELGFEIFVRNRKGISGATVKGNEFIEQARILLRQFSALEALKAKNLSSFGLASSLFMQPQDAFLALCDECAADPDLKMDLWFCPCFEAANRIKSLESDIGVVAILDDKYNEWLNYFKSNDIEYHTLYHAPVSVTLSKDDPLASKGLISSEDLISHTYIAEKCSRMNDLTANVFALIEKISPGARITVPSTDIMYTLIGKTAVKAFAFDPFPLKKETLEKYGLVSVPFEDSFSAYLGYIFLEGRKLSDIAIRYIELLHEEFGLKYVHEEE